MHQIKAFRRIPGNLINVINCRGMSNKSNLILGSEHGDKGVITINRPEALNSINLDMVRSITGYLRKWESSKSLVIIKGVGDKSFCAGGDVRALVEAGPTEESKNFFREEYTMNGIIGNYKIPYIALIDGITMGGGVGLSVHGQYRIATERTLFAMPETAIGLFADVGGSYFLPRLKGKLGLYLGLTGFRLKGKDVFKAGIATHYCESEKLGELENEILKDTKLDISTVLPRYCSTPKEEFVLEQHLNKINQCFSAPTVEGIIENLENDGSDWAKKTIDTMLKMSPTSLKVTHRELEYGANLSLEECLKMEFRMAARHLEDSDFKEGVRALLIDKDKNPQWNPKTLQEVTESRINFYFQKLPAAEELKLDNVIQGAKHKL